VVDRTRTRLDVPTLRTLFGVEQHPRAGSDRELSLREAVVIETPQWDTPADGQLTMHGDANTGIC
jgi:hypothetical protein